MCVTQDIPTSALRRRQNFSRADEMVNKKCTQQTTCFRNIKNYSHACIISHRRKPQDIHVKKAAQSKQLNSSSKNFTHTRHLTSLWLTPQRRFAARRAVRTPRVSRIYAKRDTAVGRALRRTSIYLRTQSDLETIPDPDTD